MRERVLWIFALLLVTPLSSNILAQSSELQSNDYRAQVSIAPTVDAASTRQTPQEPSARQSEEPVSSKEEPVSSKSESTSNDSSAPEKHKLRLRFGGLAVGVGYAHFSGPLYPYYPYGAYGYYPGDWYGASFWSPLWSPHPYYGPGFFSYNNGRGEVRLTADPKLAEVYIDGGYAGTADKLKTLWLDPGAYDVTVASTGHETFHQRVYVLSGKSLKITAKLNPDSGKERP